MFPQPAIVSRKGRLMMDFVTARQMRRKALLLGIAIARRTSVGRGVTGA